MVTTLYQNTRDLSVIWIRKQYFLRHIRIRFDQSLHDSPSLVERLHEVPIMV